eukprot:c15942_g1_i1 orf=499-1098(-)
MALEIGEDAVDALSLLATLADVSQVEALAMAGLSVLLRQQTEEEALSAPSFQALQVHFIKRTFSALVCLFLEAAKNDLSISQLSAFLTTDCGLQDGVVEALCSAFHHHKPDLSRSLSLTANHTYLPRLQGVDWNLHYCISSSQDRAHREFLYNVRFKTLDSVSGKEDGLEVTCSLEDLQDLVSRLRDACKSVERVVDRR